MSKPSGWLQLRCVLKGSRPSIWREIRLPAAIKLSRLHRVLQELFGWKNYHLHEFEQHGIVYEDPALADEDWSEQEAVDYTGMCLADLVDTAGEKLLYRYDFGDGWEVQLSVLGAGGEELPADLLGGERAGPPEDCGGLPGLRHLNQVLAHPRHPEHEELRSWVGQAYRADSFPLERLRKRLQKMLTPGRQARPVLQAPTALPSTFEPQAPRLEDYDLRKLNPRMALVATLLERGQPLSLEDMEQRIRASGFPLPAGVDTLRRAWRADPILRERKDGRLELDLDHPEFWRYEVQLEEALLPASVQGETAVDWSELQRLPRGHSQLTRAHFLLAVVDATGGSATPAQVAQGLERLGRDFKWESLLRHPKVPIVKGPEALVLDLHSAWTLEARMAIRTLLNRTDSRRDFQGEVQQERERLAGAPWHLVVWQERRAVARDLKSGSQVSLEGSQLAAFLESAEVVFSADVFALFESVGVLARRHTRRYDLMPLVIHPAGHRQVPPGTSLEELIGATLGRCYPTGADLGARVPYQARFLAYGRLQGQVWCPGGPLQVWWNLDLQGTLRARLEAALQQAVAVPVSHRPSDPLQPELALRPFKVARLARESVAGRFSGSEREETLKLRDLHLCEFEAPLDSFSRLVYRLGQSRLLRDFAARGHGEEDPKGLRNRAP